MTTIDLPHTSRSGLFARVRAVVAVRVNRLAIWWRPAPSRPASSSAYDRFLGHFGLMRGTGRSAVEDQLFDEPPVRSRMAPVRRYPGGPWS